ncbi:hypothetical protein SAMN04487965_1880 [Microbulbifer donghaiensis]|uniref:Uncharacterized protein n=1 Tax=Microbulbifer donghaiensis TaxID=494016 RepID=A0A1M5AJE3_9GAMM|nr:hypothetical protein [Microbulbifer donghaiensis]SHF30256.1 hypothetical protein SAMN04487965_1880 [Microbulbifer donghaiensis]
MIESLLEQLLVLAGILLIPGGLLLLLLARLRWSSKATLAGLVLMALGALLLVRMHYVEYWRIDGCLDAGGKYDQSTGNCIQ